MKKLSYKFSYSALEAIKGVVAYWSIAVKPEDDGAKLIQAIMVKLHKRIDDKLYFRFDTKTFSFEVFEYLALRIAYTQVSNQTNSYTQAIFYELELKFGPKL